MSTPLKSGEQRGGHLPRNVIQLEKLVKTLLVIREEVVCGHLCVFMLTYTRTF